jgi:hypothetical protein
LYQLAQAFRAIGNTAGQEQALAEFNRVRSLSSNRKTAIPGAMRDVTPQVVDPKSPR